MRTEITEPQYCERCGRPAMLWGGHTCDYCDRDSNGVLDDEEPIGTGIGSVHWSLFDVPERGWQVVGELRREVVSPTGQPRVLNRLYEKIARLGGRCSVSVLGLKLIPSTPLPSREGPPTPLTLARSIRRSVKEVNRNWFSYLPQHDK